MTDQRAIPARRSDPAGSGAPVGLRGVTRRQLWELAHPTLRRLLAPLLGALPPTWLLGRRFRRQFAFAEQAQHWPLQRSRQYQLEQLRRLCTLADQRSPFYRAHFARAGFDPRDLRRVEDLAALPRIDRQTLHENLEAMCIARPRAGMDLISTGGTSGEPVYFYLDRNRSPIEYAYLVSSWGRAGYRLGLPLAVFRGQVVPPDAHGLRHACEPLLRHHHYSAFHMTDANIGRYLDHVADLGPCFLHVYPSTAAALARFLQRSGQPAPANIHGVIAESEIVYPQQRQMIEQALGCRVFSCYGHSEKLVLAAECESCSDYHFWPTYGYAELLDEAGRPVTTPGQRGEIVGTGFISSAMPMIRYRTGDWATCVGRRCSACGREGLIVRDIRGHRTQEVLICADGAVIPWAGLNMHDDTFAHVRQFQFRQDVPGQAALRLVPAEGFTSADRQRILENLGRKLNGQLHLDLELTDAIELSPRGKALYVDQRVSPSLACPPGQPEGDGPV